MTIPRAAMQHGWVYVGNCRTARVAIWDGVDKKFVVTHVDGPGIEVDRIPHIEDDPDGKFDAFEPYATLFSVIDVWFTMKEQDMEEEAKDE
jgi:hypothetical protein